MADFDALAPGDPDQVVNSQANALRVMHVEKCFGTHSQTLRKPGRVLLGEGVLTKVCRKHAKPRQVFLFNDVLVYGTIVQDKKKYSKQHVIELQDLAVIPLPDTDEWRFAWQLSSSQKSFVVLAASEQEKAEWIKRLCQATHRAPLKPGQRLADHAPTWAPDKSAAACMHCVRLGRVKKFSPIVRKHHCRNCGEVVCAECSKQKFLLPHQSSKPVRVCQSCYQRLSLGIPLDSQVDADEPGKPQAASVREPVTHGSEEDDDDEEDGEGHAGYMELMAGVTNFQEASSTLQQLVEDNPTKFYDKHEDE